MSLQQLKELGSHIIKAAESSPLQSEIAAVSLESIHNLLVTTNQNPNQIDDFRTPNAYQTHNAYDPVQMQYQPPMQQQQQGVNEYVFDAPPEQQMQPPTVIAPQYSNNILSQAQNIPFLFHNQGQ